LNCMQVPFVLYAPVEGTPSVLPLLNCTKDPTPIRTCPLAFRVLPMVAVLVVLNVDAPIAAAESAPLSVVSPVTLRVVFTTADASVATPLLVNVPVLLNPVTEDEADEIPLVTVQEFSDAAPEVLRVALLSKPEMVAEAAATVDNVVAPVTPNVVFTVADFKVAGPEVVNVPVLVNPVTVEDAADMPLVTTAEFNVATPELVMVALLNSPEIVADPELSEPVDAAPDTVREAALSEVVATRDPVLLTPLTEEEAAEIPLVMTAEFNVATPELVIVPLLSNPETVADPEVSEPVDAAPDTVREAALIEVVAVREPVLLRPLMEEEAADIAFDTARDAAEMEVLLTMLLLVRDPVFVTPSVLVPDTLNEPPEIVVLTRDPRVLDPETANVVDDSPAQIVAPDTFKPPLRMLKFLLGTSNITSSPSDAEIRREL
jgi:hypothetical protein